MTLECDILLIINNIAASLGTTVGTIVEDLTYAIAAKLGCPGA